MSVELDKNVVENMEWQKNWVILMQPVASMLKFRLPYSPGKTQYLDGKIYFQIWAGNTSSEGRLISERPYKIIEYDNSDYDNCMFYLNYCQRNAEKYDKDGVPINYDWKGERYILQEYIKNSKNDKIDKIDKMINDIDKALGSTLKNKYRIQKELEKKKLEAIEKF
jgi:hypothetical protein